MELNILKPRKALNKAFLKVKTNRNEITLFKTNLIGLLDTINGYETEEFHKNLVSKFLTDTYYGKNYFINTKGRNDLVIHNGNNGSSSVGVIIEAKKPTNKGEMITTEKLNVKAFHELVLYYLRERITNKNLEIKHLVATNINEWFIFDATLFDRLFAQNKNLVKQFIDFEGGRLADTKTDFFYKQIAEPFIADIKTAIEFTYFDMRAYEKPLRNADKNDDNTLISLYKLLSPEHLLKLPFANDSNSLDKSFYTELLHIIGLTETKEGNKKLIQRKKEGERNAGSFIESAIFQLDNLDKISRLDKPSQFGETNEERLFAVALELSITWINRILFLKLLEAQLLKYHRSDKSFAFLHHDKVKNFDDLNNLFFSVLARKPLERNDKVKILFANVPYLNSSLFEPTALEHSCLFISQLTDGNLPILSSTVIKDNNGHKCTGQLETIKYIFDFLDAYDFASEGSEEIQEDNKRLINASVLGLIFEKINGYKDGSFFTPGFITMYMARETIRHAVVQKFNETKGWNCADMHQLYDKIEDRKEANEIVNSLRICDPAVGSGHFLVSALNEIIAIKNDLKILQDQQNKRLKEYQVEVINDELIVTDEEGELFEYNPRSKESQRIQETLFHEKQTIIENCLFGVDINPNSVKICRLRLWIELLKNAYYKIPIGTGQNLSLQPELQTLPNIDINIKCGNSLISRYSLDADIKKALQRTGSKWTIDSYRLAVMTYRNAKNKEEKREMERLILIIKQDFSSEFRFNDPLKTRLDKLANELYNKFTGNFIFEPEVSYGKKEKELEKKKEKERDKLESEITELNARIQTMKEGTIYENAFEWRFEFPEALNDDGDFIGFDVVMGNPPYKMIQPNNTTLQEIGYMKSAYPFAEFKIDLFHLFFQLGYSLGKEDSYLSFIAPSTLLNNVYADKLRSYIDANNRILKIAVAHDKVFEDADVHTAIYFLQKDSIKNKENFVQTTVNIEGVIRNNESYNLINQKHFRRIANNTWNLLINEQNESIIEKVSKHKKLDKIVSINRGLITGDRNKYFSKTKETEKHIKILSGSDILRYNYNEPLEYVLFERPKTSGGCWDRDLHLAPFKICIRQIGTQPTATLIEEPYAVTGNIFTFINSDKSLLKEILAIINSKLIKYYWQIMFADLKSSFPQITINSLSQISIPDGTNEVTVRIVDQILSSKRNNIIDTSVLESEIDQLVYQLYGLTKEEIEVVKSSIKLPHIVQL